jgi:hypothetical protein
MSQFANFDQPAKPNPFAAPPPGGQGPKKSRAWLWILLGAGGMGVLFCCGCAGLFALGWNEVGRQLTVQLNADPTAQQHLGEVTSASMDLVATGEAAQGVQDKSQQKIVFQVKGKKSDGKVSARQVPGGFSDATLILPSGEEVKLGF